MNDILHGAPELIVEYTDPEEGFKGWLVMDSLSHKMCAGGMRVQQGLTCETVSSLARNMTLKMRIAGIRADGVKSGIDYDPKSPGKPAAMYRFMRSIRAHVLDRYSMGPDMNVTMQELDSIGAKLGIPSVKMAIAEAQGMDLSEFLKRYELLSLTVENSNLTLGRLRAGLGLASCCLGVLDHIGIPHREARVVLQGFGGLGSGAAHTLHQAGVKIVGIADSEKALISRNGQALDVDVLLRNSKGGMVPLGSMHGEYVSSDQLLTNNNYDVFIPAAIRGAVNGDNAHDIKVKAIVPGANLAITPEAEMILYDRGIITVPCFVAGAGGSVSMDALFGPKLFPSVEEVLNLIDGRMRFLTQKVLARSKKDNITPRQAALALCAETVSHPEAKPYGPLLNPI